MKGYKRKSRCYDRNGRMMRRVCDVSGARLYVVGATVGQVKRLVGKLAKKVRRAANGDVEVIHTHNGSGNRSRPGIYQLSGRLSELRTHRGV